MPPPSMSPSSLPLSSMPPSGTSVDALGRFEEFAAALSAGDPFAVAILLLLGAAFLLLVGGLVLRRKGAARESAAAEGAFDRSQAVLGRLEKLERSMNELRTETSRNLELVRSEHARLQGLLSTGERVAPLPEELPPPVSPDQAEEDVGMEVEVTAPVHVPPAAEPEVPVERLTERLTKTRRGLFERIRSVFTSKPLLDEAALEELEATLVSADLGAGTVQGLLGEVRAELKAGQEIGEEALTGLLKMKLLSILERDAPLNPSILPERRGGEPLIVMMVGVNGVGKTTTTAKLASTWREHGAKVLMVAADTFRAAAVEQLQEWGRRIDVPVVAGPPEAKPGTVVFDAMVRARDEGVDAVIIDTAGRLHTKSNLMEELHGVRNVIQRHCAGAPHESILVVDGSTGQNAISQAREFNAAVPLTGLIVTKLDGTPKGGVVVGIKNELGIPVRYIGVGESRHDLRPFSPRDFVEALFDVSGISEGGETVSAHGETRRRRRRDTQGYD